MPVQETRVEIDLDRIQRRWGSIKRALPTEESIRKYMRINGVLSLEDLKVLQEKIDKRIKEDESGWFMQIMQTLWYQARGYLKIDLETLYWLMSNFDKVADYMPNEFWKSVLLAIDKVGEHLLANIKEK